MKTHRFLTLAFAIATAAFSSAHAGAKASLSAVHPRCEGMESPAGIDVTAPRFGWQLQATEPTARGLRQTSWQVLAASSSELLAKDQGDLWDSGKVDSNETRSNLYQGKPLASSQQVFWKVRVWDQNQSPSPWSSTATLTMGVLHPDDWKAKWISATEASTPRTLGYHAEVTRREDDPKWVQIDLGKPLPIEIVRLIPMAHDGKNGFGFPVRFKIEVSDDASFAQSVVWRDQTTSDFKNPGTNPVESSKSGIVARHVRVTATKHWPRGNGEFCYALRQIVVMSGGRNAAVNAPVQARDSTEDYGWGKAGLTDGVLDSGGGASIQNLLLRREFTVKPGLRRAVAHVSGLGHYEMTLNGTKAGDDLLTPGWTDYHDTVLYDTRDITKLLKPGINATGISLGNGMYHVENGRYTKFIGSFGPQKVIAQIRLEYADGSVDWVATDSKWRTHAGPITLSHTYSGEDHDARLEPTGWNKPGFNATAWTAAIETNGPGGSLKGLSVSGHPIRVIEEIKPISQKEIRPGVVVYDLGQNASIMPRLRVSGMAGSKVKIVPAELLQPDGTIHDPLCHGNSYWTYTLSGNGHESWFPRFFYRGGRYLQVELVPDKPGGTPPRISAISAAVVHADAPVSGNFTSSNELFNRTWTLIRWAQRSNMFSVMTDCPHREKLGWLEEDHLNGPALRYNYDLGALFAKLMNDMADSQEPNGFVPNIAPEYVKFGGDNDANPFRNSPEWGSAFILVAWQQYLFNGDLELLRRHYDAMKRYVSYLEGKAQGHILDFGLGDWYDIGPKHPGVSQLTPKALTATAIYFEDVTVLARTASLLGKADDAVAYDSKAKEIRAAFNAKFFNSTTKIYATGSQTANSMPIVLGLVEPENRQAVIDAIVSDVEQKGLTAGDVGYRYLLRALADGGRSDVIFAMNNQSEKPGYGYQLKRGATSLTEAWDANPGPSQNHFMLGQINEWFYHDLAGIQPDPGAPGFAKIVIKPALVDGMAFVKADFKSIRGLIQSHWQHEKSVFRLHTVIPPNTSAEVFIPVRQGGTVTEGGKPADKAAGVKFLRNEGNRSVYEVGSGAYDFEAVLKE